MTTSLLLKYARARDDRDFVWRISAAAMVCAQGHAADTSGTASRSLADYVLERPMSELPLLINHVSTSPDVAASITVENNIIDTSNVPDADIQSVVDAKWDLVAAAMFPAGGTV